MRQCILKKWCSTVVFANTSRAELKCMVTSRELCYCVSSATTGKLLPTGQVCGAVYIVVTGGLGDFKQF